MSLDKQIKEMATNQLNDICTRAEEAVNRVVQGTPLGAEDVARIVSGHKTQTTFASCVKKLETRIGQSMLSAMETAKEIDA